MSHATKVFSGGRGPLAAASLAFLALLLVPPPVEAQLGGLVRKAADAAAKKAGDDASQLVGEDVKYDTLTVELTPERVDRMIRGMQAGRATLAGRPALVEKRDKVAEQLANHLSRHGEAIASARDKRAQIEQCREEALTEIADKREEDLGPQMMANPAFREKMTALAMRLADAQARSDVDAIKQIEKEMKALTAPTRADSAAVDKKCGGVPPQTPAEAEASSLQDQVSGLDAQIQSLEQSAAAAEAKASGMPPRVFHVARERIEMWMARLASRQKQSGLGSNELKALNDRRDDIKKAM